MRAANQTKSAYWMALVKSFSPVMTHSSPSRSARVCSEARSVPAEGSVYPMEKWSSPRRIPGRMRSFCSGVPSCMMAGPTLPRVNSGRATPAQCDSSTRSIWSTGPRP